MSTGSQVMTALAAAVQTALPDTTIEYATLPAESAIPQDLLVAPNSYTVLLISDVNTERLEFRQWRYTWVIDGQLYPDNTLSRVEVQDMMDLIRAEVEKDETLGEVVLRSTLDTQVVDSHGDASRSIGLFTFQGEWIAA